MVGDAPVAGDGESVVPLGTAIATDGYAVVRNVLTADELSVLREQVIDSLSISGLIKGGGRVLPNAAVEAPELDWVFAHPKIVDAVRQCVGSSSLTFTMEADLHWNYQAAAWHKDTGEQVMEGGYFGRSPIGDDSCRVIKAALYLQDHLDGTGLWVRPGSHLTPALDVGPEQPVETRAGDAVLFDVRLTHRGSVPTQVDLAIGKLARLLPASSRGRFQVWLRGAKLRATGTPLRLAVFHAYGLPGVATETFARRNMHRQLEQLGSAPTQLSAKLTEMLDRENVGVVAL